MNERFASVQPETPIHVRIVGNHFCTVFPMVAPRAEELTWGQRLHQRSSMARTGLAATWGHSDEVSSGLNYVMTKADKE